MSLLLRLCVVVVVIGWTCCASAATTAGPSTILSSSLQPGSDDDDRHTRPPFLSHVTTEQIQRALVIAKQRHDAAVQQALSNYPVDDVVVTTTNNIIDPNDDSTTSTNQQQQRQQLRAYPLSCEGSLPDFGTVIPSTVYVTDPPLLSAEECATVVEDAERYFQQTNNGKWPLQQSGQYHVSGFYIHQVPTVKEWFIQTVRSRLFPLLAQTFPHFVSSPHDLCVDNAYLFKYTTETGRRTDVHTDSGCLSFTIALNPSTEYKGGGTWFQGLHLTNDKTTATGGGGGDVLSMNVGQVTIRPGGVKHCGYAVTAGTRYIIGGFCMHRNKAEHVRMLLQQQGDTTSSDTNDQQRELLEVATVLNPESDAAYNLLANCYEKAGDVKKAQQVLEYCLQHVHGTSGEVAYSLGSIYMKQKLYPKALECMRICLQTDAYDVDAMMGMATASAGLGDRTTEEHYYQQIIAIPGANPTMVASAYCNLGVLHEGDDSEMDYYEKCLALLPNNYAARYSLACAHASRQEWSMAVSAFREAIAVLQLNTSSGTNEEEDHGTGASTMQTALQSLYTATAHLLQSQPRPATQEAMIERFQETMGVDNYNRLVALRQQRG